MSLGVYSVRADEDVCRAQDRVIMYFDVHAHIDRYDENHLTSALDEIERLTIRTIAVSMDIPSYQNALKIAGNSKYIIPVFGVHPWNAPDYSDKLDSLKSWVDKSPMLGEVGLDFYFVKDGSKHKSQLIVFEYLLSLAQESNKIINVHTKGAEKDVLALLKKYDIKKTIVHWYSGGLPALNKLIDHGVYFSVGFEVMYSSAIKTIAAAIPEDQLLVETDNPGGYYGQTGRPGMPSLIIEVVKTLSDIHGCSVDEMNTILQENLSSLATGNSQLLDWIE